MKFKLTRTSKVVTRPGHTEERYHYESEDGQTVVFNAGEEPWTWEIIGGVSRPTALRLIEKFCEVGARPENIQELEVN